MQQPQSDYILTQIMRQLEILDERTRNLVTRIDLEALRKELVARESLEPQLNELRRQIQRVDADRLEDKKVLGGRMDELKTETISKQDRLWMRLGQIAGLAALGLALFEFLSHFKFIP